MTSVLKNSGLFLKPADVFHDVIDIRWFEPHQSLACRQTANDEPLLRWPPLAETLHRRDDSVHRPCEETAGP